jgi:hypothetical protein
VRCCCRKRSSNWGRPGRRREGECIVEELQQQSRAGRKKKNKKKVNASSFSHVDSFPSHASSTWSRVNFSHAHSVCLSSLLRARYTQFVPLNSLEIQDWLRACRSKLRMPCVLFLKPQNRLLVRVCYRVHLCFSCREVHVWCLFPEDITGEDTALWKTYKELLSPSEKTDIEQCSNNPKMQTEKLLARTLVRTTLARCNPNYFLMSLFCLRHCSICLLACFACWSLLEARLSQPDSQSKFSGL